MSEEQKLSQYVVDHLAYNEKMRELQTQAMESARREAERKAAPLRHLALAEANLASEFYDRLSKWIDDFDATLDDNTEVGVKLVSFGESISFHLRDMDFFNPSLIRFIGVLDSGSQVELIQHVTQISILLMKLPRTNPEEPKRRMGFQAILDESKKPVAPVDLSEFKVEGVE